MANLTPSSPAEDFVRDLADRAYEFEMLAANFEAKHRQVAPGFSYSVRNGPNEIPDRYSLFLGFTMVMSQLHLIVNQISDLEDVAKGEEDDEIEESDIYHTYGELYALKEIYIRLRLNIHALENKRLEATQEGMNPRAFMGSLLRNGGIPKIDAGGGFAFANSNSLDTARLLTGTIPSSAISVSSLVPTVPPLFP